MPERPSRERKRNTGFLWLSVCVLPLIAAVIVLHTGIPAPCLDLLSRRLGSERLAVIIESAYAPSLGSFRMKNIRVARRGEAVPAWLNIGAATWSWRPGKTMVLHLEDVVATRPGGTGKNRIPGNPQSWPKLNFTLEGERINLLGLKLRRFQADAIIAEGYIDLENLVAESASDSLGEGRIAGALSLDLETGGVSGRIEGKHDPTDFIPLFQALNAPELSRIIRRFEFSQPASCKDFDFAYDSLRNTRRMHMFLRVDAFRYRGVQLDAASGRFEAKGHEDWETVRIENLTIDHAEGRLAGDLEYDPRNKMLTARAESTLPPQPLSGILNLPRPPEGIRVYPPPLITVTGRVDMSDSPSRTRLQGSGAAETAEVGPFSLRNIALKYQINADAYDISSLQAGLANGTLDGRILGRRDRSGSITGRQVRVLLTNAELGEVLHSIAKRPLDIEGVMDLSLDLSLPPGQGDLAESASGQGEVNIRHTRLFRLPLFSGLTDLLAKHIPGVRSLVSQTEAFCAFDVREGMFKTDNAMIEGDVFSLQAEGEYHFTNRLDFVIQLRFLRSRSLGGKVLRVVGYPISKLFEIRLEGPLEDPRWRTLRILERIMPESKDP